MKRLFLEKFRNERIKIINNKSENEKVFLEKFRNETNLPEYNKKCWKDFKFH